MVNKADGDNKRKALVTRADYEQILHYIRPATEGWTTKAYTCSALTGEGIAEIWDVIQDFDQQMRASNQLFVRRQEQSMLWVQQMAMEHLQHRVEQNTAITACREHVQQQVLADQMTATMAAKVLIETIDQELAKGPEGSF